MTQENPGRMGRIMRFFALLSRLLVIASSSDERADVANFTEVQRCVKHYAELQTGRIIITLQGTLFDQL